MWQPLLVFLIVVGGAWLALFVGIFIAIFRHVRRRGRAIMLGGLALTLALVITSVAYAIIANAPVSLPTRPSPSSALLAEAWPESSGYMDIIGVSARDGSIRWRVHTNSTFARSTQAAGVFYVTSGSALSGPVIAAYRVADGALLWQEAPPVAYIISPPLVAPGLVIFSAQSRANGDPLVLYALDVATGAVRWSAYTPGLLASLNQLALVVSGALLVESLTSGAVSAVRLSDGQAVWSRQVTQGAASLSLITSSQLLYAYDDVSGVIALRPTDGAIVWRSRETLIPTYSGRWLSFSGAHLYACASSGGASLPALIALDPTTGAHRWSYQLACGAVAPVESAGAVYVTDARSLVALRASDGAVLWRDAIAQPDLSYTSLQVESGVVFAVASVFFPHIFLTCPDWWRTGIFSCHSQPYLAAFDGATGAEYWRRIPG